MLTRMQKIPSPSWLSHTLEQASPALRRVMYFGALTNMLALMPSVYMLEVYDRVREAGYPAEIRPVKEGDKSAYAVRLANLPSRAEAEALAASLKGQLGLDELKVSR